MALHNGIDTVAIASFGVYSETYGAGEEGNIANLFASFGYLEDATESTGEGFLKEVKLNIVKLYEVILNSVILNPEAN